MIGVCVPCSNGYHVLNEGEYCKYDGTWWARPPGCKGISNLAAHTVTECANGKISVSPSIMLWRGEKIEWHGHLENGVWREA